MSYTAEAPQDSVLRRHWQASRDTHASSASNKPAASGGFFSWLKSIFG